ncbi:hypothetical protein D3C78_638770 [compost metagenome]
MTDTRSNIPDFATPVLGADGRVNPIWWQFFLKLFARTGFEPGTSATDMSDEIAALTGQVASLQTDVTALNDEIDGVAADLDDEAATAQSLVPNDAVAQLGLMFLQAVAEAQVQVVRLRGEVPVEVSIHGIHADPELHALATPTTAGFMSAADKAKLDSL